MVAVSAVDGDYHHECLAMFDEGIHAAPEGEWICDRSYQQERISGVNYRRYDKLLSNFRNIYFAQYKRKINALDKFSLRIHIKDGFILNQRNWRIQINLFVLIGFFAYFFVCTGGDAKNKEKQMDMSSIQVVIHPVIEGYSVTLKMTAKNVSKNDAYIENIFLKIG